MISLPDYSDIAKKVYGNACEFNGCGWAEASCDVHHINYKEQQKIERKIRTAIRTGDKDKVTELLIYAKSKGFLKFDFSELQLSKNDDPSNLTVLCPNHHRYVHFKDIGMAVLDHIPRRKQG